MNAKEYLSQARYLDCRINSKIQQIAVLEAQVTKVTASLSGMPHNPNGGSSAMEATMVKLLDLRAELDQDMNQLMALKQEIADTVKAVPDVRLQMLLELRYLCFQPWDKIAEEMHCDIRWVYRLHNKALEAVGELRGKCLQGCAACGTMGLRNEAFCRGGNTI